MSGTFRISQPASSTMELFPADPLTKRWAPQRVGTGGSGAPIFAAFWRIEMGFGSLPYSDAKFFESRFVAGGLFSAYLPHPTSGALVGFTGTAIEDFSFQWNDVERNSWVDDARLTMRVNLFATGSF